MLNTLQRHLHALKTARRMTLGLLDGFTGAAWLHQPIPTGQHALWIVGHLALADDWGLLSVGRPPRQLAPYDAFFSSGGGESDQGEGSGESSGESGRTASTATMPAAPIIPDPAAYPPIEEVLHNFHQANERFLAALALVTEHDLARPTSGPISDFAPDLGTLLSSHIWHEGFHTGQLALIRRSLGMGIRFG